MTLNTDPSGLCSVVTSVLGIYGFGRLQDGLDKFWFQESKG